MNVWSMPLGGIPRLKAPVYSKAALTYWVYVTLIIFNVASPKAGIQLYDLPLTFGYMLLAVVAPVAMVGLVRRPTLSSMAIANFIAYLLVGLTALYKTFLFGAAASSVAISFASFVVLPAIMLIALCAHLEYLTEQQIGGILKWCMRFVIVWGIMNFVLYFLFKHIIEIKYVTINAGEVSSVFNKNNRRGSLMKLISTYNNGNIFGVCMIMLAPVYIYFEKSRAWVVAFLVAIVLSLSRTTWFGLLAVGFMMVLTGQIRLSRGWFWIAMAGSIALVFAMMATLGWSSSNIIDPNLGGRMVQWTDLTLSPFGEDTFRIAEILYAGLLRSFGVVGLIFSVGALAFPIVYALVNIGKMSVLRRAAAVGCAGYLLAAFFDAAFIYPPTIVIYLFLSIIIYRRGYRMPSGVPLSQRTPAGAFPAAQTA